METKHTSGPWEIVTDHDILKGPAIMNGRKVIAQIPDWRGDSFDTLETEEMQANQKLIASAPDLLKALQELAHEVQYQCSIGSDPRYRKMLDLYQNAQQAIGSATT
jgi:hypothetical protein